MCDLALKRKHKLSLFSSKRTTIFVLLDISEWKYFMEAILCCEFYHGLPTHVKLTTQYMASINYVEKGNKIYITFGLAS
jgi:hypothetical protein